MITFLQVYPDRYFDSIYEVINKQTTCEFVKSDNSSINTDILIINGAPKNPIKSKYTILVINKNPLVSDIESFSNNATFPTIDSVWLNTHYASYTSYIQCALKSNVHIIPNLWTPLYDKIYTPVESGLTDIVIVGNHGSINMSGIKPLLICEGLVQLIPDKIGTIYYMNMQTHNEKLRNYISLLEINKKIRLFVGLSDSTIIGHFLKPKNNVIFLSHSLYDEFPSIFYDILKSKFPFVHTCKQLSESGNYYNPMYIDQAIDQIKTIIETKKYNVDEYKEKQTDSVIFYKLISDITKNPVNTRFSDLVSRAVYINLDKRPDRRTQIENELANILPKEKIQRFTAIEHVLGMVGCSKSHIEVLKMAQREKWPNVLIVEDDFMLTSNVHEGIAQFCELAKNPHDVIMLGGTFVHCFRNGRVQYAASAVGYFVQSHYYSTLISNFEEGVDQLLKTRSYGKYACDRYWNILQLNDNWFIPTPMICKQRESYSDIEKDTRNYDQYYKVTYLN